MDPDPKKQEAVLATSSSHASSSTPRPFTSASSAAPSPAGGHALGSTFSTHPPSSAGPDVSKLRLFLHATASENLAPIHDQGLIAGKSQGIGLPDVGGRGAPDPKNVYVAKPGGLKYTSQEAGPGLVRVVSGVPPAPDLNYKPGHAGMYDDAVPPVRNARGLDDPGPGPYSFTTPLTPRTSAGIHALVKARNPGASEDESVSAVTDAFRDEFGIHIRAEEAEQRREAERREEEARRAATEPPHEDSGSDVGGDDDLQFDMDDL